MVQIEAINLPTGGVGLIIHTPSFSGGLNAEIEGLTHNLNNDILKAYIVGFKGENTNSNTSQLFFGFLQGGAGIYGLTISPDLNAAIQSGPDYRDLPTSIVGSNPYHTYSDPYEIALGLPPGGAGIAISGATNSPDLRAKLEVFVVRKGEGDLLAEISSLGGGTTISASTTGTDIIYNELVPGGVAINADNVTPDLIGIIDAKRYDSDTSNLNAEIFGPTGLFSTSTTSGDLIYLSFEYGGAGLVTQIITPDLVAVINPKSRIESDQGDLNATYAGFFSTSGDLSGYIVPVLPSSGDLNAEISGSIYRDLLGYIVALQSGSQDLNAEIEPIPPKDLLATLHGYVFEDLEAEILPIEPSVLSGTISGQAYLDLLSHISGFDFNDLYSTYSGFYKQDVSATVTGLAPGSGNLSGLIRGFLEIGASGNLGAYYTIVSGANQSLSGNIYGYTYRDLLAKISTSTVQDLPTTISGFFPDGVLFATLSGRGLIKDLSANIRPTLNSFSPLSGFIDGFAQSDLPATYLADDGTSTIQAQITASGPRQDIFLNAIISSLIPYDLSCTYTGIEGGGLHATIVPIPGFDLGAIIKSNVSYIESFLPINTYPVKDLNALINANSCLPQSNFLDLSVNISGINFKDLSASVISVSGQYAQANDYLEIQTQEYTIAEDWLAIWAYQPVFAQNFIPLIITNSPLLDLFASIYGVPQHSDLIANIVPVYISSIDRQGVPLGEIVNTKTGEKKILKLFFKGTAQDFYYSSLASKTYPASATDSLTIIIETYIRDDSGDGTNLLAKKIKTRQCVIDNLSDFENIDEAIKYAIKCAANEISNDLNATITAKGNLDTIGGTISGIDSKFLSNLGANIITTLNDPIISGTISGTGGYQDLYSNIVATIPDLTGTFIYSGPDVYAPRLVYDPFTDSYNVILTLVTPSGSIFLNPDLTVSIDGTDYSDIETTISGM